MHIPIVIRQEARSAAKRSYALLFVISFMFLRQIYACPVKLVRFPQIFLIFFSFCKRKAARLSGFGPDTGQVYNGLHGSLHRVDRTVLEFAVEIHAAGKQVRARQAHVR